MNEKIERDFFLWFCHWGCLNEKEKQQDAETTHERALGKGNSKQVARRHETAEHNRKAREK